MSLNSSLQVSVAVGQRELLSSGVVHVHGLETITFSVANLKFIFTFKTDEGSARYVGLKKDDALYIDLFNFKNPLGEGLLVPVEIAKVSERTISLTYYVSTVDIDDNARRFEFAIYADASK